MRSRYLRCLISPLIFIFLSAIGLLTFALPATVRAAGSNCVVADTAGNGVDYTLIQAAVDDGACTKISVRPGIYHENLTITRSLTLIGADADSTIIDGGGIDRVIQVLAGAVNISALTIRQGYSFDPSSFTAPGGAGVFNLGNLTLSASVVEDSSVFGYYAAGGGGIYNGNVMTVLDTTVRNNYSTQQGGGIDNAGEMEIVNSEIANNRSDRNEGGYSGGGGLYTHPGSATVLRSTLVISNAVTGNEGGGIFNGGHLDLVNASVLNNVAGNSGGGIFNTGELIVDYSNIVGNISQTQGGGIRSLGSLTLVNSTVANNFAQTEGGGVYAGTNEGSLSIWIHNNQFKANLVDVSTTAGRSGALQLTFGYGELSTVVVDGNFVLENEACAVGMEGRGITLTNNIIATNRAGGICTDGGANPGDSYITNNTVMFNNESGILVSNPRDLVVHVTNNILAGNQHYGFDYSVFDGAFTGATLAHNVFWENGIANLHAPQDPPIIGANGNQVVAPQLIDPVNGDWHLSAFSPLIDAGQLALAPNLDFERNSRPVNNGVDIGADEYSDVNPLFALILTVITKSD